MPAPAAKHAAHSEPKAKPSAAPAKPAPAVKIVAAAKPPAVKPESKNAKPSLLDIAEGQKSDEEKTEAPIIETAAEAIKKMIKKGKERGYVTID
mgnify:CR=1 FL=1